VISVRFPFSRRICLQFFAHRFASGNDDDFMRSSWAVKKAGVLDSEKMIKSKTHACLLNPWGPGADMRVCCLENQSITFFYHRNQFDNFFLDNQTKAPLLSAKMFTGSAKLQVASILH
jgi:hypothetical protein